MLIDSISGFKVYEPGQNGDAELLAWYAEVCADGSIDVAFGSSMRPMAAFFKTMTEETTALLYVADERGWWGVSWFSVCMGGVTWGLWLRRDKRESHDPARIHFTFDTLEAAYRVYPLILVPTKQVAVATLAESMGFKNLGKIPYLFEGEECFILYQTWEMFAPVLDHWRNHDGRSRKS